MIFPCSSASITPKSDASADRHTDACNGDRSTGLDVLIHHLARIHAVDVIGTKHDHVIGSLVCEDVEVLEDCICRPREPVRTSPHLRRDRRDVVPEHLAHRPAESKVAVEAVTLVLGEDGDLPIAGVDEIREDEVDQTIDASERHSGFRSIARVSGQSRFPSPPASTSAMTFGSMADKSAAVSRRTSCPRKNTTAVAVTRGVQPPPRDRSAR